MENNCDTYIRRSFLGDFIHFIIFFQKISDFLLNNIYNRACCHSFWSFVRRPMLKIKQIIFVVGLASHNIQGNNCS